MSKKEENKGNVNQTERKDLIDEGNYPREGASKEVNSTEVKMIAGVNDADL